MIYILTILAIAIAMDIVLSGGNSISNIFKAIGNIFQPSQPKPQDTREEKYVLIENLKEEINELYDDLSYETTPIGENLIREQIKYKQELIDKLLGA